MEFTFYWHTPIFILELVSTRYGSEILLQYLKSAETKFQKVLGSISDAYKG